MKIAVLQFPGSNCETETMHAVEQAGMQAEEFLWNADHRLLSTYDGYVIIGGFSYEDRSRSGIIASLDPVMKVIKDEAAKGKPVLGICNGAQILVESGLIPGLPHHGLGMALAINRRVRGGQILGTGYYNTWVHIRLDPLTGPSAFTRHITPGTIFRMPVAHGEGRFVMEESLLKEMSDRQLTVFRYCDETGNKNSEFPTNPNGATDNLAAISNSDGNVMAIMPHPERTPDGQPLFLSMRNYIARLERFTPAPPLNYSKLEILPSPYSQISHGLTFTVRLLITDNEAKTVEETLKVLGIHANIKRYTHWEIEMKQNILTDVLSQTILESEVLFNPKKEVLVDLNYEKKDNTRYLLVRYRDDIFGQSTQEILTHRLGMAGVKRVMRGTLWQISIERGNIDAVAKHILDTHILYNPFSQECFVIGNKK